MKTIITIVLALCLVSATARPVIGLLSIPSKVDGHPAANYSYVPASYVKLIESAGAQVVPIPYDASPENVTFLLNQLNGVFFIGGGADLNEKDKDGKFVPSNLSATGLAIVNHVKDSKDNFPLMAVCLGWEMLLMSLSNNFTGTLMYGKYKEFNIAAPIDLAVHKNTTRIWADLPQSTINNAQSKPYFFFDHTHGILEEDFNISTIPKTLKITSTSKPLNGGPSFVASAEGIDKPIFGSQFHPEKLAYEWNVPAPRDAEALSISQHYINTFIGEAKKNNRTFAKNETLTQSLIYNFVPSADSASFSQVYTFPTVVQNKTAYPAFFPAAKKVDDKNTTKTDEKNTTNTTKIEAHIGGSVSVSALPAQDTRMLRGTNNF